MTINLETLLPILASVAVSMLVAWGNLRKQRAETGVVAAKAGIDTARGQYEIWKQEWSNIIAVLERRLLAAETARDELYKEMLQIQARCEELEEQKLLAEQSLAHLQAKLNDCAEKLTLIEKRV